MNDPLYVEMPALALTPEQERDFAVQWGDLQAGDDYRLRRPKHTFLCWLVETQPVLLHGSDDPDVSIFMPREKRDFNDEPVRAVFATSDGIWPIYFAISNRRVVVSQINDCVHEAGGARYFFSVATEPDGAYPWTRGTIYVLPRAAFTSGHGGVEWLNPDPVRPLARLWIDPEEFPFLAAVFRHQRHEGVAEVEQRLRSEGARVFASEA
jgi:hypothetical protein